MESKEDCDPFSVLKEVSICAVFCIELSRIAMKPGFGLSFFLHHLQSWIWTYSTFLHLSAPIGALGMLISVSRAYLSIPEHTRGHDDDQDDCQDDILIFLWLSRAYWSIQEHTWDGDQDDMLIRACSSESMLIQKVCSSERVLIRAYSSENVLIRELAHQQALRRFLWASQTRHSKETWGTLSNMKVRKPWGTFRNIKETIRDHKGTW